MAGVAWISLVVDDLYSSLSSGVVNRMREGFLKMGQADPFLDILPEVVARVRNAIQTGGGMVSATSTAIPPEIKTYACWLILQSMGSRIQYDFTDQQMMMIKDANDFLKQISAGKVKVSTPLDAMAVTVQQQGGVSVVGATCYQTRETLNGL
jgi:hypothetical protein